METENPLENLYHIVKAQIADTVVSVELTNKVVSKARNKVFSTDKPHEYLDLLEEIVEGLLSELEKSNRGLEKNYKKGDRAEILEISGDVWATINSSKNLRPLVRYADSASTESVPWGLLEMFTRICESINSSIELMVRTKWSHSYEILPLNYLLERAIGDVRDMHQRVAGKSNFLILSFPVSEKTNILAHGIWAHEIAHHLDEILFRDEFGTTRKLSLKEKGRISTRVIREKTALTYSDVLGTRIIDKQTTEMEDIVKSSNGDSKTKKRVERIMENIKRSKTLHFDRIYRSWITEAFCDLLSLKLFGPFVIFSLFENGQKETNYLGRLTDSHPPYSIRLEILCKEYLDNWVIDEGQRTIEHKHVLPLIENEVTRIMEVCRIDQESNFYERNNFTYKMFSASIGEIRSMARGIKKPYFLTWKNNWFQASRNINELLKLLEENVPPNKPYLENKELPSTLVEIISAGWLDWRRRQKETMKKIDAFKKLDDEFSLVNRLLLKAIESSEIQRKYIEIQDKENSVDPEVEHDNK